MNSVVYVIKGGDCNVSFDVPYDDEMAKVRFRNLSAGMTGLKLFKIEGKQKTQLLPPPQIKKPVCQSIKIGHAVRPRYTTV